MPEPPADVLAAWSAMAAAAPADRLLFFAWLPLPAPDGTVPAWMTNASKTQAATMLGRGLSQRLAETSARLSGRPAPAFAAVDHTNQPTLLKNLYFPAQAALEKRWLLLLLTIATADLGTGYVGWVGNSRWLHTAAVLQLLGSAIYRVPATDWRAYRNG